MKTKYLLLALAVMFPLVACNKDPQNDQKEEAVITVTPDHVDALWEGAVADVDVKANCSWNVSKTDAEGTAVSWVKCDRTSGKGDVKLGIKVEKNPDGAARSATVTIYSGDVKAFVDIRQEANPDPNPNPDPDPDPDPQPQNLELVFDFTGSAGMEGWPLNKDESWAALKNCDSGCAADNGGEEVAANSHRRAQVTYTLSGTGYDFSIADPNGAVAHNIYLSAGKGMYVGTLRYFGLPAIEGKKIVGLEMVQGASNKDPETFTRNVGVAKWVYHKDVEIDKVEYVAGGEPQNQAITTDGTVYTYDLSGTAPNTVYWLFASTNASIVRSLKLIYADADGSETPLGPEPADPAVNPDPDPDPDPQPDPEPDPGAKTLVFDFTGTPLEGWPTAKYEHVEGGIECIYPLDGVNYVFVPADCGGASAAQAFWMPPVEGGAAGYFAINAQYRYLGLPAIEGFTLFRVVCHNVKLSSTTPKVGITTLINGTAAHPAADAYVAGGDLQSWDANGGGTYTYTLSGTLPNTRYYLYGYAKGGISVLELTYNPAK